MKGEEKAGEEAEEEKEKGEKEEEEEEKKKEKRKLHRHRRCCVAAVSRLPTEGFSAKRPRRRVRP